VVHVAPPSTERTKVPSTMPTATVLDKNVTTRASPECTGVNVVPPSVVRYMPVPEAPRPIRSSAKSKVNMSSGDASQESPPSRLIKLPKFPVVSPKLVV